MPDCNICGAKGVPLFTHAAICDNCRMKAWAAERERMAAREQYERSVRRHPSNPRRPRPVYCTCRTIAPVCRIHGNSWEEEVV